MPRLKLAFAKLHNWYWIIVVAVVFNSWFLRFGARTAGDWGYFVKAASDTLRRHYFSIWLSDTQFGRVLIDAGQAPTYAAYGYLSYYLHTGYDLNERLIHLWPSVIVAIVSSYALAKYIFNDKHAAVLSSIIYSANTYFLALLTGGLTLSGAYAFAPAIVLTYIKYVATNDKKQAIFCSLLLAACGAYEPRVAYIVAFSLLLYAFVHLATETSARKDNWIRAVLCAVPRLSLPFVIFGLLNIYWLLGLTMAGGSSSASVIASSLFGNEFFRMPEALTLHHPFWTGGQIQPFFQHPIPLYFWLIPITAIGGVLVARKTTTTLFFALVGIFGILLAKQSDEPFASLYGWLFAHLPGFNAFREASKFYILIALSYSILIPLLYIWLKKRVRSKRVGHAIFIGLALLFIPNLIPIATNAIGGTFTSKAMPAGYQQLNNALAAVPSGRVLWVPQKSRWSYSDVNHPAVSASQLIDVSWAALHGGFSQNNNATTTDEITSLLGQNYAAKLLAVGNIKYVIVPLRDIQNGDNFYRNYNDDPALFATALAKQGYLKPAKLQIPGFSIFETTHNPESYFSSTDTVYSLNKAEDLSAAYSIVPKTTSDTGNFDFVLHAPQSNYLHTFTDAYQGLSAIKPSDKTVSASLQATRTNYLYTASPYATLSYEFKNNAFLFTSKATNIANSDGQINQTVMPVQAAANKQYIIDMGKSVRNLSRKTGNHYLGVPLDGSSVYSLESDNLIPTTASKNPWGMQFKDCAQYGTLKPDIAMQIQAEKQPQASSVSLITQNHAGCAQLPSVAVKPLTKYLLSFQYTGKDAQLAGYRISYGSGNESIHEDIPLSDNRWHDEQRILTIPSGVTSLTASFVGRPTNQLMKTAVNSYRAFNLQELGSSAVVYQAQPALQQPLAVQGSASIQQQLYAYKNQIPNGDLSKGLWHKSVDDCDKYDANPELKISLLKGVIPHKANAVSLAARRHIACTSLSGVPVQGSHTYLLQFAYQSPNAGNAYYSVDMNDPLNTVVEESVPIKDHAWHTYSRLIDIPPGASQLRLTVYAQSEDGNTEYLVNNYGQFRLVNVPDLQQRVYDITKPKAALQNPKAITYQNLNSTTKQVVIKGADKPFVLVMHEQYHPGWKLLAPGGAFANNFLPNRQASSAISANHFQIDGFANAWLIDPATICAQRKSVCNRMADGTYTMKLTARFLPQTWFNLGMLISGGTLLACLLALVFLWIQAVRHQRKAGHTYGKRS